MKAEVHYVACYLKQAGEELSGAIAAAEKVTEQGHGKWGKKDQP